MNSIFEHRSFAKPIATSLLGVVLGLASSSAAAQCAEGALNGSWDMYYGNAAVPGTQCQLRVKDDKKLSGQCRILGLPCGFSDWIKISKGRLKVASNCAVTGRFTITFTPGLFLTDDAGAQVEILAGRTRADGESIDGILIWQDPTSPDGNPVFYNAGFSMVRR